MSNFRQLTKTNEIIIHCAAWPNGKPLSVDQVDGWHNDNGFQRDPNLMVTHEPHIGHVGYHYFIGVSGGLHPCRALYETGAHARGHNTRSIGICLSGTDQYTTHQWQTLASLVSSLLRLFPHARVIGHNEISNKTCPGFNVSAWLRNEMRPLAIHVLSNAEREKS